MSLFSSPLMGMFLSALAFAGFTMFDTVTKILSDRYSVYQLMMVEFSVACFTILFCSVLTNPHAIKDNLAIHKPWLHILRGFIMCVSSIMFIIGFTHMPLTEFYVFIFLIPIWVALLSAFFLKEKITYPLVVALCLSFIGVIIALKPQSGLSIYSLLVFVATFLNATGIIVLRHMFKTESTVMTAVTVM